MYQYCVYRIAKKTEMNDNEVIITNHDDGSVDVNIGNNVDGRTVSRGAYYNNRGKNVTYTVTGANGSVTYHQNDEDDVTVTSTNNTTSHLNMTGVRSKGDLSTTNVSNYTDRRNNNKKSQPANNDIMDNIKTFVAICGLVGGVGYVLYKLLSK